jgi:hypothetical protein
MARLDYARLKSFEGVSCRRRPLYETTTFEFSRSSRRLSLASFDLAGHFNILDHVALAT